MSYYKKIFSERPFLESLDLCRLDGPAYVIDMSALQRNLEILGTVQRRSGAKILLALKAFSAYATFPLIREYLPGCCVSSPYEARLAREEFGGEVHSFAPAYSQKDLEEQLKYSDHIIFNSLKQLSRYKPSVQQHLREVSVGLRVNPLHSETQCELYDPCAPGSRLGILASELSAEKLTGVDGLHFHTLCQENSDALQRTAEAFESQFGEYLPQMKWLNFGGGHHITQPDYDVDLLCEVIDYFKNKYEVEVYLEPGEAVAVNTGALVCSVLDIVENEVTTAILDISATCHMPDVLEMPYRPEVRGAGLSGEKLYTYRLGGLSCLAGDVVGDYSFDQQLKIGDKISLDDMSHYTMVKSSNFNGIAHPEIVLYHAAEDRLEIVNSFNYESYKARL